MHVIVMGQCRPRQAKSIVCAGGRAGVTAKHVIVMGQCRQSPLCGRGGRAGVTAKRFIVMGQCRQSPLCGWVEGLE